MQSVRGAGPEPPQNTHRQAFIILAPQCVQAAVVGVWEEGRPGSEAVSVSEELQPRAQNKLSQPGLGEGKGAVYISRFHPLLFHSSANKISLWGGVLYLSRKKQLHKKNRTTSKTSPSLGGRTLGAGETGEANPAGLLLRVQVSRVQNFSN